VSSRLAVWPETAPQMPANRHAVRALQSHLIGFTGVLLPNARVRRKALSARSLHLKVERNPATNSVVRHNLKRGIVDHDREIDIELRAPMAARS